MMAERQVVVLREAQTWVQRGTADAFDEAGGLLEGTSGMPTGWKGYFRSVPDEPRALHRGDPAAQRDRRAAHGAHAQQHHPGCAGAPRAHARQERLLGAGTDHASIATEAKVVRLLAEQGIKKSAIGREKFLEHAFAWKEKYGGVILEQLKKLGASCDWDRTRFTMEPDLSEAVIDVFIDLHKKGLVYRGLRMVNWDPVALTAVSDEEVIHKEVNSKFYHVRYADGRRANDQWVTIATTRPETILGDTAVAVHPEDERYAHLKGKARAGAVDRPQHPHDLR
jgi:leucyl-tRNA synthetase